MSFEQVVERMRVLHLEQAAAFKSYRRTSFIALRAQLEQQIRIRARELQALHTQLAGLKRENEARARRPARIAGERREHERV